MKQGILFIIILGFYFLLSSGSANAQQREVRNAKGNLEYTIDKDGTIRLPGGRIRGKVTKDGDMEIRDSKGRVVLRKQNDRIMDNRGRTQYRVTPSAVLDAQGRKIATKDSTSIKDMKGKTLYRIE